MPIKWTAENDQRLLYLIINQVQVKGADLLKAWKENYCMYHSTYIETSMPLTPLQARMERRRQRLELSTTISGS
jgi:hypothetical protein